MSAPPSASRGRGRPRGTGSVAPSAIIEAAIDAIVHGGYEALSMRGVARTLGVSLGAVQHHFRTKAELYRAVVEYALADADRQRSMEPARDLRQRIRNALDSSSARPGLFAAFLGDRAPGHEERLAHFAEQFRALFAEPAETLAELRPSGAARPVDAEAFMVLLTIGISTIGGVPEAVRSIYGIDLTNEDERNRIADGLADIVNNGILDASAPPSAE